MKSLLPALLFLCSFAHAQYLPSFSEPELQPCYGGDEVLTMANWEIYQTLDNTWDGPRDTTVCIDVNLNSFKLNFNSSQADVSRPIFLQAKVDTTSDIGPHELWKYGLSFSWPISVIVDNVDYCNDGFCSGMLLEVDVPLSDTTFITRRQFANYDGSGFDYAVEMCVPYEYPEFSRLRTFVLKLLVEENSNIELYPLLAEDFSWSTLYLDSTNILPFNSGNSYVMYDLWGQSNFVIPYDEVDGFPSEQAISYFDVYPVPNVPEQAEIELLFIENTSLTFEPFSALRAGLREGSDSLRHSLSLINNGMEVCMYPFIEVVIMPHMSYVHNMGSINFGYKSCIRFQYNSDLIVSKDAHFVCGTMGEGMLATDDGSRITVEENATFEINNGIVLFDSPWMQGEQWTEVDVYEGGKIVFKEGAYVKSFVENKRYKWLIRLHGGSADLGGLSPEDRQYFVVVGQDAEVKTHDLVLLGNPTKSTVNFEFNTYELGEWQLEVFDERGKLHLREALILETSKNNRTLDVATLPAGMYILTLKKDDQSVQERMVISQ